MTNTHTRNINNIEKLGDNTKVKAKALLEYCEKNGLNILIYSTIRTLAEQKANVASGASKTMRSYHLVGQALDFVMLDSKGNCLWNGYNSANCKKVVAKAKSLGFTWGGDWTSFKDSPHLQYEYKGYGTDTFGKKATVANVNTSTKTSTNTKVNGIKQVGTIKVVNLNNFTYIYEKTSDTSKKLGKANKNELLPISGSVSGWYEVIHEGKRAYVKSKYCKLV